MLECVYAGWYLRAMGHCMGDAVSVIIAPQGCSPGLLAHGPKHDLTHGLSSDSNIWVNTERNLMENGQFDG